MTAGMFTGLVEEKGQVLALTQDATTGVWRLQVKAKTVAQGIALGDSVAVNGCCLTVAAQEGSTLSFDVLDLLRRGVGVNLERSLTPTSRMGGHFVTGHVDGTGEVFFFGQEGANHRLRISPPPEFMKYLVYKGSVAVDGISLTVASVDEDAFDIWLIPHTLELTNLGERRAGDPVNLEFDILAKYVERLGAQG